jgi:hypothetical protein
MSWIGIWWRQLSGTPYSVKVLIVALGFLCLALVCVVCSAGTMIGIEYGRFGIELFGATSTANPPQLLGDHAVLGGTERGFTRKFGEPYITSPAAALYRYSDTTAEVSISITFDQGTDHSPHVSSIAITIQLSARVWSEQAADQELLRFVPADAVHHSDAKQSDYTEHVFQSQDLVATFPLMLFHDDNQVLLPPGTFDLYCAEVANGGIGLCALGLGTLGAMAPPCNADSRANAVNIIAFALASSRLPSVMASPAPTITATPTATPSPTPTQTPVSPTSTSQPSSTPTPQNSPTPGQRVTPTPACP